jgi:hypothetical protein
MVNMLRCYYGCTYLNLKIIWEQVIQQANLKGYVKFQDPIPPGIFDTQTAKDLKDCWCIPEKYESSKPYAFSASYLKIVFAQFYFSKLCSRLIVQCDVCVARLSC